ncbi:MAG: hypothetical protein JKX97_05610 [Candidatus Lindowbacteria bacterium]|nr:hypothetical protein [Candidatus Lindowbacteria bacterium]
MDQLIEEGSESAPNLMLPPRISRKSFYVTCYEWAMLILVMIQYSSVILFFSYYTQNFVLIKDMLAGFLSILIFCIWVILRFATTRNRIRALIY